MKNQIFTLTNDSEFITLDNLLKLLRLVGSGGEAHVVITEGLVRFNGELEFQKRKKVRAGDTVEFNSQTIEVKA